jgi:hypothetical protein
MGAQRVNIDAFLESAVEAELTMPEVIAELRLESDATSIHRAMVLLRRLVRSRLAGLWWRDWPDKLNGGATEEDAELAFLDPEPLLPRHVVVGLTDRGRQQALKRQRRQWRRASERRGDVVQLDRGTSD